MSFKSQAGDLTTPLSSLVSAPQCLHYEFFVQYLIRISLDAISTAPLNKSKDLNSYSLISASKENQYVFHLCCWLPSICTIISNLSTPIASLNTKNPLQSDWRHYWLWIEAHELIMSLNYVCQGMHLYYMLNNAYSKKEIIEKEKLKSENKDTSAPRRKIERFMNSHHLQIEIQ